MGDETNTRTSPAEGASIDDKMPNPPTAEDEPPSNAGSNLILVGKEATTREEGSNLILVGKEATTREEGALIAKEATTSEEGSNLVVLVAGEANVQGEVSSKEVASNAASDLRARRRLLRGNTQNHMTYRKSLISSVGC